MPSPEGSSSKALADLDLFIVDESIDQLDGTSTGSILVSVLEQVTEGQVGRGSLCYLHGRVASLASLPAAVEVIVHGEGDELSDLQSQRTPDLEASPDIVQKPHNAKHLLIQSPPRVSAASVLQPVAKAALDSSPRPSRRPSRAQLKKLDTSESLQAYRSSGSSALSHRSESLEAGTSRPNSRTSNISLQELCRIQSSSPRNTPLNSTLSSQVSSPVQAAHSNLQSTEVFKTRAPSPISPGTAQQEEEEFLISTVIPNFIYLGPEPQTKEDMAQLKDLGIHQILNMALEIDEGDMGRQFEKYVKIPMRDFVDETGVQGRIDEACALLGQSNPYAATLRPAAHCAVQTTQT